MQLLLYPLEEQLNREVVGQEAPTSTGDLGNSPVFVYICRWPFFGSIPKLFGLLRLVDIDQ